MSDITRDDLGYITQELAEVRRALQDIAQAIYMLGEKLTNNRRKKENGTERPNEG